MDIDLIINIAIGYLLGETVIGIWNRIKYNVIMLIIERNKENE